MICMRNPAWAKPRSQRSARAVNQNAPSSIAAGLAARVTVITKLYNSARYMEIVWPNLACLHAYPWTRWLPYP